MSAVTTKHKKGFILGILIAKRSVEHTTCESQTLYLLVIHFKM